MAMTFSTPGVQEFTLRDQDNLFDEIVSSIEEKGYFVGLNALPDGILNLLKAHALGNDDGYHLASIGRGTDNTLAKKIRNDKVSWLFEGDEALKPWFSWAADLKSHVNRSLFLGLFSFECHLARYEPGDFYKKHIDAFRGEANRILTLVTYLNEHWTEEQGGELLLFSEDGQSVIEVIKPEAGTVVVFLSEVFPHEVLPSRAVRHSVAGWFRLNTSVSGRVDPPR